MPKSPTSSDLISPEYLAEQKLLHADPRGYGGRGDKWAEVVANLIPDPRRLCRILDYGAGQATLQRAVMTKVAATHAVEWVSYDPAVAAIANAPEGQFDLVVCTDVLEHVEPEKIERVLTHLRRLVKDGGQLFTVISLVETAKTLSDGRQAHILLRDAQWWREKMLAHRLMWDGETYPNPKPEKQFVATWRPI